MIPKPKKTACVAFRVMDIFDEVKTIARITRIGTKRHTSSIDKINTIFCL